MIRSWRTCKYPHSKYPHSMWLHCAFAVNIHILCGYTLQSQSPSVKSQSKGFMSSEIFQHNLLKIKTSPNLSLHSDILTSYICILPFQHYAYNTHD